MPNFIKHYDKRTAIARKRIMTTLIALLAASPLMADIYYISTKTGGKIGSLEFKNEDILKFDTAMGDNGEWSILFDGSDVGLTGQRIDGFYVADEYLLLSFAGSPKLDLGGQKTRIRSSDIVKFNWDSTSGPGADETKGTFDLYFDASDVGVKGNIDALTLNDEGNLVFSTNSKNRLRNQEGQLFLARKQDLVKFIGNTGADTQGSFSLFFDGRRAGLTHNREDINGAHLGGSYLYLATRGKFEVGAVAGNNEDILRCKLPSMPMLSLPIVSCEDPVIAFKGADYHLARESLQDIQVALTIEAADDQFTIEENELLNSVNVLNDNGHGQDTDPKNLQLTVTEIKDSNGNSLTVGSQNVLPSGALLTLNAEGSFIYDDNHKFDHLGDQPGQVHTAQEHFSYRVEDGSGDFDTATVTITLNGKNDAPTISSQKQMSTPEDIPVTLTLADLNVNDPDNAYPTGFTLKVSGGINYTLSGDTIIPATNYNGTLTVPVVVNDGAIDSAPFDLTVTISAVNDQPVVTPATFAIFENSMNGTVVGTVAASDIDVPAQTLTYTITGGNTGGAFAIDPGTGQITVANGSALDFETTPSFALTVTATDNGAPSMSGNAAVTINLLNVNEAPVAVNDAAIVDEGGTVTALTSAATSVAFNDSDPDAGGLQFATTQLVSGPTQASVFTLNADGTFSYTHDGSETIADSFIYEICDSGPLCATATVSITINPVNDAPVILSLAGDNLVYFSGEQPKAIDQGNDAGATDADSANFDTGKLTVSIPAGLVAGEDQLGILDQGIAAGQLGVSGSNITYNPGTGAVIIGRFSGGGAGGSDLVVALNANANADAPAVSALLRNITYFNSNSATPDTAIRSARFVLTDGDGGTSANYDSVITISLNKPPVLTAGGASPSFTENGGALVLDNALVVTDANDANLASATVTITNLLDAGVESLAVNTAGTAITASYNAPTLTLTGADTVAHYEQVLRSVSYLNTSQNPDTTDRSITFIASDGIANSNAVTKILTVVSVNDPPSFIKGPDQTVSEQAGAQTVAGWATAIDDGDPNVTQTLTFNVIGNDNPSLFSVAPAVAEDGTLTYTLAANASGSASITLTLQDNGGIANGGIDTSAAQTFMVTVNSVNDVPSFTKGPDQAVSEDAVAQTVSNWATAISAGPANESGQTLTFNIFGNTNPGLFSTGPTVAPDGTLSYTPAANANGVATVTIVLKDNGGTANGGVDTSVAQSFVIAVNAVNDVPSFTNGGDQTVAEDAGAQTVAGWATAVSAGAANESGQTLNFNITGNTNPGLFSVGPVVEPNGALSYTPAPNASGSASITLVLQDNGGTANSGVDTSSTQSFSINVTAVDDPPVAVDDSAAVAEDSIANALDVVANDTDVDGGPKSVVSVTQPTNGAVFITGGGSGISYQPSANYCNSLNASSTDSFTYTLTPGGSSATVNVAVTCVNDAPVAQTKSASAQANMKIIGLGGVSMLTAGVIDADNGVSGCSPSFTVANVASGTGGTVSNFNAGSGTFDFEPAAGFTGTASATYTVNDNGCTGSATSAPATINITVSGPIIWFVDDSASAGGDGRLGREFQTVSAATAAIGGGTNHKIFVYSGNYTQGATLNTDGWIIGQGVSGSFDSLFGITPPAGTLARPSVGGTRPTLGNTVTLGANSQVKGLNLSNGANNGIVASGKTGLVTGEVSVTTTTGTAANILNSAGTLSFTAISAGTAASGPANGIVLNTTTGSFTVTGTGSAGSGGTIQKGATGISLTNAQNVSLSRMQLNDFTDFAIRGSSVAGFALDNTVISGVNGNDAVADEGSVRFTGLTGSATISNCNISGGFEDNVKVVNTSGTLNRLTFANTAIGANSTSSGNDGIGIEAQGAGTVLNVTVQSSVFTSARGDLFQLNVIGNSTSDLIFTGNTLSNNHPSIATGGGGVTISGGDNTGAGATLTSSITNNTFRDAVGNALLFVKSTDPGTFKGSVSNNQIGVAAIADSGSLEGSALKIQNAGLGAVTVAVTNNQIRQYNNFGIELVTGGGASALSGALNATVTGNTVSNPGSNPNVSVPKNGVHLNGGTVPGDTYQICTDIGGAGALANSLVGSGALGGSDFRLRQRQSTTLRLPGYGGSSTDDAAVVTFVQGRNTGGPSGLASHNAPPGGGFVGGEVCPSP